MKRVQLAFMRRPALSLLGHASDARTRTAAVLLSGVLLALSAWLGWQVAAAHGELEAVEAQLATVRSQWPATQPPDAPAATPASPLQQRQLNLVIRQLNTPWPQIFDALEESTPPGVALLLIEPDSQRRTLRLQAEARTLDALLAYAARLRRPPLFEDVQLVKHETLTQDANRPAQLSLQVQLQATAAVAQERAR